MKYLAAFLLFACSCASVRNFDDSCASAWSGDKEKSAQLSVRSIKRRLSRFEILATIKNNYSVPILIRANAFQLSANGVDGAIEQTNPDLSIAPGDTASVKLRAQMAADKAEYQNGCLSLRHVTAGDKELLPIKVEIPHEPHTWFFTAFTFGAFIPKKPGCL